MLSAAAGAVKCGLNKTFQNKNPVSQFNLLEQSCLALASEFGATGRLP
jgi:hypothetical protein